MKQFRVTQIITTDDGRVILTGPSGSIDIFRRDDDVSIARLHSVQYDPSSDGPETHRVRIDELPKSADWGSAQAINFVF